jgi:hypothetical protein
MRRQTIRTFAHVIAALVALAAPRPAFAQGADAGRVSVTIGPGIQLTTTDATTTTTFEAYSEEGSMTAGYSAKYQPTLEGGVVIRVRGAFGVGIAGSYLHDSGDAGIHALIPHPFTVNQPRTLDATTPALHEQTAIHLQVAYWIQRSPRLDLIISGGPSFFHATQDFVTGVSYTETPPFDSVTFTSATVTRDHESAFGGNVGLEAGWRLTPHVGVAAVGRYSRGTASFTSENADVVLGGMRLSGALRLLF